MVEHFVDTTYVLSTSGVTPGAAPAPTRDASNPLLPVASDTWDNSKTYHEVIFDGTTYHLLYGSGDSLGNRFSCYATSTDGVAFTKPTVGLYTYDGTTNNNIVLDEYLAGAAFDGTTWYISAEHPSDTAVLVYTASSPSGPYTQVKGIAMASTETRSITRRIDGRWMLFYVNGHPTRDLGAHLSATSDVTGSWAHLGHLIPSSDPAANTYTLHAYQVADDLWLGLHTLQDNTTELSTLGVKASRDGSAWSDVIVDWLTPAASGAWDDGWLLGGSFVEDGDEWHFYYAANDQDHTAGPMAIGRFTIQRGRIANYTGTGTITTDYLHPAPGAILTVNANAAGGSLVLALVDANGTDLAGYAASDFDTITTDSLSHAPTWGGQAMPTDVSFQIRFTLTTATLWAYEVA